MFKRKSYIIVLLIFLAVIGVVVFVTLIMKEPKTDFDGVLVRAWSLRGVDL